MYKYFDCPNKKGKLFPKWDTRRHDAEGRAPTSLDIILQIKLFNIHQQRFNFLE